MTGARTETGPFMTWSHISNWNHVDSYRLSLKVYVRFTGLYSKTGETQYCCPLICHLTTSPSWLFLSLICTNHKKALSFFLLRWQSLFEQERWCNKEALWSTLFNLEKLAIKLPKAYRIELKIFRFHCRTTIFSNKPDSSPA